MQNSSSERRARDVDKHIDTFMFQLHIDIASEQSRVARTRARLPENVNLVRAHIVELLVFHVWI